SAVIEQRTSDLTAALFGPDGKQVAKFDSRWHGPEPVCFVAEISGNYRLAIQPFSPTAARASYRAKIEELRVPVPRDQTRITAIKGSTEGKELIDRGNAQSYQSAKGKYEEMLPIWRDLGDRFAEALTLHCLGFVTAILGRPIEALEYYNQSLTI